MKTKINKGDVFGRLTVVEEVERKRLPSGQTNRVIRCLCDCGKYTDVRLLHLVRLRIRSCGCILRKANSLSSNPLYKVLKGMKDRCCGKVYKSPLYKKNGITVCDDWLDPQNFIDWAEKNGYQKGLQIDRIDNSKGYFPENCRWVTPIENQNNKSDTFIVKYKGRHIPFMMLIREKGLFKNKEAIRARIKRGWKIEDAFDKPARKLSMRSTKELSINKTT